APEVGVEAGGGPAGVGLLEGAGQVLEPELAQDGGVVLDFPEVFPLRLGKGQVRFAGPPVGSLDRARQAVPEQAPPPQGAERTDRQGGTGEAAVQQGTHGKDSSYRSRAPEFAAGKQTWPALPSSSVFRRGAAAAAVPVPKEFPGRAARKR